MKSLWHVIHNPMIGYVIVRLKDINEPIHEGNLEYLGEYSDNKEELERKADELNDNAILGLRDKVVEK